MDDTPPRAHLSAMPTHRPAHGPHVAKVAVWTTGRLRAVLAPGVFVGGRRSGGLDKRRREVWLSTPTELLSSFFFLRNSRTCIVGFSDAVYLLVIEGVISVD